MVTHGELFAGVSGFGLGFERAGIKTLWRVEVDPTCQRVLRRHYPDDLLLSDVRECGAHNLPPVDIITFGSPCQDMSVAGKRVGLGGERSGLFFEAARIVRELRPAIAVWENVPGALSSNNGRDFGRVLDELADAGALDLAWRVLDSQWFGVAQRRRRVFLVADLGGSRAGEILSVPQGGAGDPPPSREAGQRVVACPQDGAGITGTLNGSGDGHRGFRHDEGIVAATLAAYKGRNQIEQTYLPGAHALTAHPNGYRAEPTSETLIAHTLRSEGADASEDGTGRGTPLVPLFAAGCHGSNGAGIGQEGDPAPCLDTTGALAVGSAMAVRRLTPLECERLMGLPDVQKSAIIGVCTESRRTAALAASLNPRSPSSASPVVESASRLSAWSAGEPSLTPLPAPVPPVVLNVSIDLEHEAVRISSPERLLWSANTADEPSTSPLRVPIGTFARLAARTITTLESEVRAGRAASLRSSGLFLAPWSGSTIALLCGQEIGEPAADVVQCIETATPHSTSTTLPVTASSPNYDSTSTILCSSVLSAIATFIPEATWRMNSFALRVNLTSGWTSHDDRDNRIADSARYRMCGNGVVTNVCEWIGRRIVRALEAS